MATQQKPMATITENAISVYHDGILYPPILKSHPNFEKIRESIKIGRWEKIPSLMDSSTKIKKFLSDCNQVSLENGVIKYKDEILSNLITQRILTLMTEGFEFKPLLNFIENLQQNPSKRSVVELYKFLENKSLPITEDGHFLAYKAVKNNYMDIYSGTYDNSIGQKPEIKRELVDDNKDIHCSRGLHVGAISYVKSYGHFSDGPIRPDGNRLMIVKVNPSDAVCVPSDHNCSKLRVCKYEVVGEITDIDKILNGVVYTKELTESIPTNQSDEEEIDDDFEDLDFEEVECDCGCNTSTTEALVHTDEDYFLGRRTGALHKSTGKGYSPKFSESKKYMRGYKNGYENTK